MLGEIDSLRYQLDEMQAALNGHLSEKLALQEKHNTLWVKYIKTRNLKQKTIKEIIFKKEVKEVLPWWLVPVGVITLIFHIVG